MLRKLLFLVYPAVLCIAAAYAYWDYSVKSHRMEIQRQEKSLVELATSLREKPIDQWKSTASIGVVEFTFDESLEVEQTPVDGESASVPRELLLTAVTQSPTPVTVGQQSAVCIIKFDGQKSRNFVLATKKGG